MIFDMKPDPPDLDLPDPLFLEPVSEGPPSKCYLPRSRYERLIEEAEKVEGEPGWLAGMDLAVNDNLPEGVAVLVDRRGRIVNIFGLGDGDDGPDR